MKLVRVLLVLFTSLSLAPGVVAFGQSYDPGDFKVESKVFVLDKDNRPLKKAAESAMVTIESEGCPDLIITLSGIGEADAHGGPFFQKSPVTYGRLKLDFEDEAKQTENHTYEVKVHYVYQVAVSVVPAPNSGFVSAKPIVVEGKITGTVIKSTTGKLAVSLSNERITPANGKKDLEISKEGDGVIEVHFETIASKLKTNQRDEKVGEHLIFPAGGNMGGMQAVVKVNVK